MWRTRIPNHTVQGVLGEGGPVSIRVCLQWYSKKMTRPVKVSGGRHPFLEGRGEEQELPKDQMSSVKIVERIPHLLHCLELMSVVSH